MWSGVLREPSESDRQEIRDGRPFKAGVITPAVTVYRYRMNHLEFYDDSYGWVRSIGTLPDAIKYFRGFANSPEYQ